MEENNLSRAQDITGKWSSKRAIAFRLVNISLAMALIDYLVGMTFAIIGKEYSFEFPYQVFWALLGSGLIALGFTLPEWFSKK